MANEYLKRQPTSSGNSRRWTISFWMKNSDPTQGYTAIMGAGKASPTNVYNEIFYNGSQTGLNLDNSSASDNYNITANPLLRDPSSWMHVVVSFTDQGDNANTRIKFYINGAFTDHNTGTALDVSETSFFNHRDYIHYIGSRAQQSYGTTTFDAQYFDVFLVDGQALTADVFGFYKDGKGYQSSGSSDSTDFGPGQWSPHSPRKIKSEIERKGGFGVNGFYLPMNDSSNPGADFHTTPNSIIKLKGEDLPQPRNGAPTTTDAYVSQLRQETGTLGFDGVVKFDGTDDYLSIPTSSDFAFGTGDFTVEFFTYLVSTQDCHFYESRALQSSRRPLIRLSSGSVRYYNDGADRITGPTLNAGQWYHIAVSRSSGVSRLFVNGTSFGTYNDSIDILAPTANLIIASNETGNNRFVDGFISNLRVVKGTAVYTSNFTAPTEPLTNVTNTKLLCCNSSTSATSATVTPGTITANGNAFATRNELTGSVVLAVPGASLKNDIDLDDTELIDSTGWVDYAGDNATVTVSSGTVTVDNGASNVNGRAISAAFNTTVGQSYKISFRAVSNTGGANFYTEIRQSNGFGSTQVFNAGTTLGFHDFSFVATETAHTFTLYALATGGSTTYSDISIKETNNLIGNGSFDFNTTGWTAVDATITWSNGRAQTNRTGGSGYTGYQAITVESGKRYTLSGVIDSTGTGNRQDLRILDNLASSGGSMVLNVSGTNNEVVQNSGSFTSSQTTYYVYLVSDNQGTGFFDNIVVKQEDAPRDYSADIKGSGTNKTLTANGSAGVGYDIPGYYGSGMNFPNGGSSGGDDCLRVTDNDFSFGTGDFTVEVWINPDSVYNYKTIFATRPNNSGHTDGFNMWIDANGKTGVYSNAFLTQTASGTITPNQWTHVVAERHNGKLITYVNGVAAAVQSSNTQNYTRTVASIGLLAAANQESFTGQMQDLRVYKGVAKYKGGFDVSKPYTPVGIESWRQVSDTCKNNFPTLNPLDTSQLSTSNGNSSIDQSSGGWHSLLGTHYVRSGKWYAEMRIDRLGWIFFGVDQTWLETRTRHIGGQTGSKGAGLVYNTASRGDITYNGTNNAYTGGDATAANGDIISIALDLDNNNVKFYKNNVLQYNLSNILESGADYAFGVSPYSDVAATVNFGQNPTFSGTVTAGTYADGNGKGLFKYQPPAGFLALCEDNLPTPAIADPGEHFKTVLYTGDASAGRSITGVGFKPDLIWFKSRNSTTSHVLNDTVRGVTEHLSSDDTSAASTPTYPYLNSMNNDGFSLLGGTSSGGNVSGRNMVAWCWKAGGAAVTNTDGALTSQVSVNQDAGFSIATYTTPGTATNFGHGLGKKPAFALFKARNDSGNWAVYHQSLGTNTIRLSTADPQDTSSDAFNGTAPTDTLMYLGTWAGTNGTNINWVSYLWAEVEGYSKFGSYVGNGNADGPFVYCGFKPAWVMIKATSGTRNWRINDSSRSSSNPVDKEIYPNLSNSEATFVNQDFLSNGFKLRNSNTQYNTDGVTYIFMAFAESPFQTANAK